MVRCGGGSVEGSLARRRLLLRGCCRLIADSDEYVGWTISLLIFYPGNSSILSFIYTHTHIVPYPLIGLSFLPFPCSECPPASHVYPLMSGPCVLLS